METRLSLQGFIFAGLSLRISHFTMLRTIALLSNEVDKDSTLVESLISLDAELLMIQEELEAEFHRLYDLSKFADLIHRLFFGDLPAISQAVDEIYDGLSEICCNGAGGAEAGKKEAAEAFRLRIEAELRARWEEIQAHSFYAEPLRGLDIIMAQENDLIILGHCKKKLSGGEADRVANVIERHRQDLAALERGLEVGRETPVRVTGRKSLLH